MSKIKLMEETKEMKLREKEDKRKEREEKKKEREELKKAKEANRAEKKRKAATQKGKCSKKPKKTDDVTTTTTSRMETQMTYRCTYCEAAWSESDPELWIQCDECCLWTHASYAGYESDDDLDDVAFFGACE